MSKKMKVSILCLTYNQDKYITECLEGFLKQKTNFDFEILINDDSSTDKTVKIIQNYQRKYPQIVKPILQEENRYSKGERNFFLRFLMPRAEGEYIALCEGDDYWTDPNKLQTQVNFMDSHSDYALCFHPVNVIYQDSDAKDFIFPDIDDASWYSLEELLKTNYIPTNSVMYRAQTYENMPKNIAPGDWFLHLYHAQFGKIKYMNKVMSVYRKHREGIWWEYDQDRDKIWLKHGVEHIAMQDEVLKMYKDNNKYREVIETNVEQLFGQFLQVDQRQNSHITVDVIEKFPQYAGLVLQKLTNTIEEQRNIIEKKESLLSKAKADKVRLKNELEGAKDNLKAIKSSRSYKLATKISRTKRKLTFS